MVGVVPMAAIMAGFGVGATKLTIDSIKRVKYINDTISERKYK